MSDTDLPPLVLSGFMGTGKSTIGKMVAERLSVPFVDLDRRVAEQRGCSIRDIFEREGESVFRDLESAALRDALREGTCVVSVGGGALVRDENRKLALQNARVVTLVASPKTIYSRTRNSSRPLLATDTPEKTIAELLLARQGAYAECHARVSSDSRAPQEVADEIIQCWKERAIALRLGERAYAVRFSEDAPARVAEVLRNLSPTSVFLMTDETVDALHGEAFRTRLAHYGFPVTATHAFSPGEHKKTLTAVEAACAKLIQCGADRRSVAISLGGGVVTDMGGFVAAILLRGIRCISVPTTLLAMVDASVGGKTGVDLGLAKNAVGAFYQPASVVIDPNYARTESARAFTSALAEVVKAGVIADQWLISLLEARGRSLASDAESLSEAIYRAVRVKADIVERDEREDGDRALLNFGHTFGHALEAAGGFQRFTHGEAVALGMVAMLRVGEALGKTPPAVAARILKLLQILNLPSELDRQSALAALPYLGLDKKRHGHTVRAVLATEVGRCVVFPLSLADLAENLDRAFPT